MLGRNVLIGVDFQCSLLPKVEFPIVVDDACSRDSTSVDHPVEGRFPDSDVLLHHSRRTEVFYMFPSVASSVSSALTLPSLDRLLLNVSA